MTPQEQQAEELAKECELAITEQFEVGNSSRFMDEAPDWDNVEEGQVAKIIEKHLPISHWLACEEALRIVTSKVCSEDSWRTRAKAQDVGFKALQSLDNWRKDKENK